jgi:large subunit ribosomal protein L5
MTMNVLKEKYQKEVVPALMKEFSFSNIMQVPKLEKIVLNIGMGEALDNPKALDAAVADVESITGQKPVLTIAKKSIANFKLREGRIIGTKVTLRGEKMWAFFDRLVNIALPRLRDFRGISRNSFDGRGNYTLGLHEQLIFPEIDYDKIDKVRGMEITIVTSAPNDEQSVALLGKLGMPFRKV